MTNKETNWFGIITTICITIIIVAYIIFDLRIGKRLMVIIKDGKVYLTPEMYVVDTHGKPVSLQRYRINMRKERDNGFIANP
jgi:hypothetical protein